MSKLAESASRLLQRFGELAEFQTAAANSSFDPITGESLTQDVQTYVGNVYPSRYMSTDIDGTTIRQGDIRLITEKLQERPEKGWRVTVDKIQYRIIDVKHIRRSSADIIYICQIRVN